MNKSDQKQTGRLEPKPYLPDPVMLSRQIDSLREVMDRMQRPENQSVDRLIARKLEQMTQM